MTPEDLGLGALFRTVSDALVVGDVHANRIVLWNPAAERIFGYGADEAIGQPLEMIATEPYRAVHRAGIARFAEGCGSGHVGSATPLELPALHRSGAELVVEFSLAPLESSPDGRRYVLAIFRDVTERKQHEQERSALAAQAAEQAAFVERLIERVPAGIAFLDRDFVFRRVNPAYAAGLGTTVDDLVGRSVYEVFIDSVRPNPRLQAVLDTGKTVQITGMERVVRVAGRTRSSYWDGTYLPMFAADGSIEGILALAEEVSARVENECLQAERVEALLEADRAKDEFLSVVSHELRTPLNFITGFASLLEDQAYGSLTAEQQGAIARISNGADRMLLLVDDLLDCAKLQAGRFELSRTPTRLGPILVEALDLMQPLAARKGITLSLDAEIEVAPVLDQTRMAQVLSNLLSNALKFTPPGGQVSVQARADGDAVRVEVRDTGCGIACDDLPRLFRRFGQLDMSNTRQSGGTGLGLAISKAIVEAHGGAIGVTSTPGEGATFWFTLPR